MLQRSYEHLIAYAVLNPAFGAQLVADPRRAALEAGYSPLLAESLVGLRAPTLADFAAALHRRVYAAAPDRAGATNQAQQPDTISATPGRRTVG